ncbi:MAG: selenium-binding protein [Chloroflexota bacterium]|nr:selenium-binding protein [Chloroflexota bacterium]
MALMTPDPTFYPSARLAIQAPPERLGYVAVLNTNGQPDAMSVVDLDPESPTYSTIVNSLKMPNVGDELHHFGWNACSASLCPYAPHPHLERRYLIVPTLRTSRIYVIDTKPDPFSPQVIKTVEADVIANRTGYSRLHTVHCGPDAIYLNGIGSAEGGAPGGILRIDHNTFEPLGAWELDRGPQTLAYDFWWHMGLDVAITSEWCTPDLFENGPSLSDIVAGNYGHKIHFWDLRRRRHLQEVDFGSENQMVLELRPSHNPTKAYGFVGVVVNNQDLSSSVWTWYQDGDKWAVTKVIDIPAEPADPALLPEALKGLGAVPPLVTDLDLSLDDKFLYVSCWGTGQMRQYDVTDPFDAKLTGVVELGGIVNKSAHPKSGPLIGAPQMVEISRDGRRVYATNSLYSSWDDTFYDNITGWMAKFNVNPEGGLSLDEDFFVDFGEGRAHQVRLEGGDASSDSFCYP